MSAKFHGRPGMRGGSARGERRGGRNKGTINKATLEIRELAEPYMIKMIDRLSYLGLHAKDMHVKVDALILLAEYVLGRVTARKN